MNKTSLLRIALGVAVLAAPALFIGPAEAQSVRSTVSRDYWDFQGHDPRRGHLGNVPGIKERMNRINEPKAAAKSVGVQGKARGTPEYGRNEEREDGRSGKKR